MISRKIWTDEEQATLMAMHAKGECLTSIARALGRTPGAIIWRAKTVGIHFPMPARKKTPQPSRRGSSRFEILF